MFDGQLAQSVAEASAPEYLFSVVIGIVVALGGAFGAYRMLVKKRVLQDTPTALIRSASQGYLELKGHAELMDGAPIYAPLSLRPCVWYRYKVEKKQATNHGNGWGNEWRRIAGDTSDSLFFLVDPTGRCAVDPEGAKVTPSASNIWYGNTPTPGRVSDSSRWMRMVGLSQMGRQYRYKEERIESGDPLYALGDFTTHGGAGANVDRNADVREVLREWKQDNEAMLKRFDANDDGNIDMQEWEAARAAAEREVDAKHANQAVAPTVDVLGHARGSRNPFILSAKSEEEMLAHFHWSAVGFSALAAIATATVLWLLSVR